jgi:hypothetical protein
MAKRFGHNVLFGAGSIDFFFTLAPLSFGIWLWHEWNVHWDLSYWAWWLEPTVILWSSAYSACILALRGSLAKKACGFISLIVLTSAALFLSGVLAWNSLINDFSLSPVNVFAVIPFVVAFSCLMRLVFLLMERFRTTVVS